MAGPSVIIVGAGPAGIRCAEALVAAGIRPTLIDEGQREGGQIYRRQPDHFTRSYATLYGTEASRAQAIHRAFESLRPHIEYLPETLAWNIANNHLYAVRGSREITLPFDALVLCTGAIDRLMPVKGWNLAGTYSLGGAQVALKAQACAIGRRVAFVGTGALLYLVATQYFKAGAQVAAVVDTSQWSQRIRALPKLLAAPLVLWKGVALTLFLRRVGVPVFGGAEPLEIQGTQLHGVRALRFRDMRGQIREIDCDAVALGYHLRAETQLADLAHCDFGFDPLTRQWRPRVDVDGRSSVANVYLAGDGMRVLGAHAAEKSGQLAALAVLRDLKFSPSEKSMVALRGEVAKLERFAQGLAEAFPWPADHAERLSDDTIVCRCEAVSAGELRAVVQHAGAQESNRAKAFSRVGMGRCQGRYCAHAAAEIIAHTASIPLEQVGRLRGQAPVKPLPVRISDDVG